MAGLVVARLGNPEDTVSAGQPIVTVVDPKKVLTVGQAKAAVVGILTQQVTIASMVRSFGDCSWLAGWAAVVALVPALFLPRVVVPKARAGRPAEAASGGTAKTPRARRLAEEAPVGSRRLSAPFESPR